METQHRKGCGKVCWKGPIAREARALDILDDARQEERAEKARALQGTNPPKRDPWKILCGYRACGREFTSDRHFGAKPRYCCSAHRELERGARQSDRMFGGRTLV